MDFNPALLSCFIMAEDAYALKIHERTARPAGILFDEIPDHAYDSPSSIYTHAVSPDFECRPVSPVSECSESSHATDDIATSSIVGFWRKRHSSLSTVPLSSDLAQSMADDTTSRTVGFGRKRHSVLSTVRPFDELAQSKIVGFGWKQRPHRHSVSGTPSPLLVPDRKQNRRSLPVIPRDGPFLVNPGLLPVHRLSLSLGSTKFPILEESSAVRPITGPLRKVSHAGRQPPKPLLLPQLLPQQVQARAPLSMSRVNLCVAVVACSRPVRFLLTRFAAARRLRLKRLSLVRPTDDESKVQEMRSFLKRLRTVYRRLRGL
ncbi:hypothetical protein K438DRAFT_1100546 [Mycena galopus ATCC 62051]|nr:hypothetical protein K438DRAFT_1100546 [Mycena galopus ATCC 62051]